MNVIEALNTRYSVRAFKPEPVSKETLLQIMAAANQAPSWADTQPWEVYIATGAPLTKVREQFLANYENGTTSSPDLPRPEDWPPALKQRMSENMSQRFAVMEIDREDKKARDASARRNYEFFGAPAVVYLCLEQNLTPWSIFDMGLCAQSMMLAAQEYGVDSIPAVSLVAYPEIIRRELNIPDNLMVLFGIALGYADDDNPANKPRSLRRQVEDVVRIIGV
ncbi:nitroreductase [Paradesulfitobacterium aromaticivorans]